MSSSLSLTLRAVLAVGLLIAFYLLALAIAGVLLFVPYAMVVYGHRISFRLTIFCLIGAVVILWSILPRRDKFIAPGPQLKSNEQPELFEAVQDIAKATAQKMPVEVFLIPDLNAWVTNRGGIMGFGSRRVMGIGLPLLQLLTISQFRAVIAHEFGHYQSGDTKLGPWIYKTRSTIGRTIVNLAEHSSLLHKPFLWYGKLFLRITHAISRQQEYSADALAARITGSRALIDGLRMIVGGTVAFQAYWTNEVVPVLNAGFRPPLAAGFSRFVSALPTGQIISKVVEHEMANGKSNPYDTHPPLRKRIAAVEKFPAGESLEQDLPAISLLNNLPELEKNLLFNLSTRLQVSALKPIAWEDVGLEVYLPMWEKLVWPYRSRLDDVAPQTLPDVSKNLTEFGRKLAKTPGSIRLSPDEYQRQTIGVLGGALALALHKQGWTLRIMPGDEFCFQSDKGQINPFKIIQQLANGEITAEAWCQQCITAGISEEPFSKVITPKVEQRKVVVGWKG